MPEPKKHMPIFCDIHSHIVYGMDDGPKTPEQSRVMIDRAVMTGVRRIIATPHVQPGIEPFDQRLFKQRLAELNEYCAEKAYPLELLPGAEVFFTDAAVRLLDSGEIPTMAGGRCVLVEWHPRVELGAFVKNVQSLFRAGYTPVVAHIERYRALWHYAALVEKLALSCDMRIQIDNEAFLDRVPLFERLFVRALMKRDLVDFVASDAHDDKYRPISMEKIYARLTQDYGQDTAARLTWENQLSLWD